MYKKQKEDAQLDALLAAKENERLIQQQNVILEQKVKERTEEVAAQNKRLINLNKEKDMLVNIVAHDLRTPLSHIRLLMQLLDMTSLDLTRDQKSYLSEIDNSADRLSQMIGRILDIPALETNQVKLKNQIIDLIELVQYVVKCFKLTSEDKEIIITLKSEPGNHFVEIDKNYMIQIGLGLSIVKKYIESMNGKIHCESQLGIGTKFIISFDSKKELTKVKN